MTTKWTEAQQKAIDMRGTDILVSAGAGSGKTAVLIERVISLITTGEKPLNVDEILVVTFTKAAAEEMRSRLHERLSELLQQDSENMHLQRQLALLPSAAVTTLHSFCLDTLKHHFDLVGLDAGFRIAHDHEIYLLQQETIEEFFERQYAAGNEMMYALADAYGGSRDDSGLVAAVQKIYDFVIAQPEPVQWLDCQMQLLRNAGSLEEIPACLYLLHKITARLCEAVRLYDEAIRIAAENNAGDAVTVLDGERKAAAALATASEQGYEPFLAMLPQICFNTLRLAKDMPGELAEIVKAKREQAKKLITDMQKQFPVDNASILLEEINAQLPMLSALNELVKGYISAFGEAKRARGIVDFADMEHYCLEILRKAHETGDTDIFERFHAVLVDEYQDINNVQETIIAEMSQNADCFMVGDIKQGIYQFRLADTELFMDKHERFREGNGGERIDLTCNFRSLSGVIDAVNHIFGKLMTPALCSIDYSDGAALECGRNNEKPQPCELYILDNEAFKLAEDDESSAAQREARLIGRRVGELLKEGAELNDMVILLRSPKNQMAAFCDELNALGINAISDSQSGYLETPEIRQLMSLLRVIDNPWQDIELASVLRGPFGNFTADELLELRGDGSGSLFEQLENAEKSGMLKAAALLKRLQSWHERAGMGRLSVFIRLLLSESGFYHMVGALSGGARRQANLNAFCDMAREFESQQARGLYSFICFVGDMLERGRDLGAARPLLAGEQAIRIMSIHRSKGLQFPIVFVAGLGKRFNMKDSSSDILLHKEFGICSRIIDRKRRIKYPTLTWQAYAERIEAESVAEELRVLYVALTRAKNRLILVGSCNNAGKFLKGVKNDGYDGEPVPFVHSFADRSFLQWICRVLYTHPDAAVLRREAEDSVNGAVDAVSHWHIEVVRDIPEAEQVLLPVSAAAEECPEEQKEYIKQLLSWQYPFAEMTRLPAKFTVTELQKLAYEPGFEHYSQSMLPERELSAADIGTAYHRVLENMDFAADIDIDFLLSSMCVSGKLSEDELRALDKGVFEAFLSSPLRESLRRADFIEKEKAFTLCVPACLLEPAAKSDEPLILQGKIDLFFRDAERNGLVLVDYKSGNRGADRDSLQKRYGRQLQFYELALQNIYHESIAASYIYMLDDRRLIKMS